MADTEGVIATVEVDGYPVIYRYIDDPEWKDFSLTRGIFANSDDT